MYAIKSLNLKKKYFLYYSDYLYSLVDKNLAFVLMLKKGTCLLKVSFWLFFYS